MTNKNIVLGGSLRSWCFERMNRHNKAPSSSHFGGAFLLLHVVHIAAVVHIEIIVGQDKY